MVHIMRSIGSLWGRLPAIIRAPISGFILLLIGTTLTTLPTLGNLKWHPEIPWALPATLLLIPFWWYAAGGGFPAATRDARRRSARGGLAGAVWFPALISAVLIAATLISFRLIMPSLWPVAPLQFPADVSVYPLTTVLGLIISVALSAAVVEELAFRGYMQRPLEEAYGIVPAVIVVGVAFWFAHLGHAELTYTHLPFHMLASILLGVLVYISRSLVAAVIAHFIADAVLLPIYVLHWPGSLHGLITARPLYESVPGGAELPFVDRMGEVFKIVMATNPLESGPHQAFVIALMAFGLILVLTMISVVYLAGKCRAVRGGGG